MSTRQASPASFAGLTTWTFVIRVFHSLIRARPSPDPTARVGSCQCKRRCDNPPPMPIGDPFVLDGGTEIGALVVHGFTGTPFEVRYLAERLAGAGITAVG